MRACFGSVLIRNQAVFIKFQEKHLKTTTFLHVDASFPGFWSPDADQLGDWPGEPRNVRGNLPVWEIQPQVLDDVVHIGEALKPQLTALTFSAR